MEILAVRVHPRRELGASHNDYSFLLFEPKTPTGKAAKYPLRLHFETQPGEWWTMNPKGDNIFGDIYYLKDGSVGKVWMVCWRNSRNFIVEAARRDGGLQLSYVRTKDDAGKSHILYDYRKQA